LRLSLNDLAPRNASLFSATARPHKLSLKNREQGRLNRTIYYVGLKIAQGFVFLSDRRTNSGVDNIVRYKKTFT